MKRTNRRSASGFTLVELLIIVLLLAVFTLIFEQLFVVTMRAQNAARKRDELLHRLDFALAALRRDAWAATAINADGPRVELLCPDGKPITWRYATTGMLTRTLEEPNVPQPSTKSWNSLPPISFTATNALLTVHVQAGGGEETLTLPSARMLSGGAP